MDGRLEVKQPFCSHKKWKQERAWDIYIIMEPGLTNAQLCCFVRKSPYLVNHCSSFSYNRPNEITCLLIILLNQTICRTKEHQSWRNVTLNTHGGWLLLIFPVPFKELETLIQKGLCLWDMTHQKVYRCAHFRLFTQSYLFPFIRLVAEVTNPMIYYWFVNFLTLIMNVLFISFVHKSMKIQGICFKSYALKQMAHSNTVHSVW